MPQASWKSLVASLQLLLNGAASRSTFTYRFEGAIPGTDLMVAYDRVRTDLARLPANRSTPLAIYCRSGRMSAIAARELATLGYTDIVELDGGMDAWTASGRRLLSRAPA